MRRVIIAAALLAVGVTAVRLGPGLAERGMRKCHEMMAGMQSSGEQGCACQGEVLKSTAV